MVSGRPADAVANCTGCGREREIYSFSDRQALVCPDCEAKQSPVQMSLLPRALERILRQTPDLPEDDDAEPTRYYIKCEGCMNPECMAPPPVNGAPQCKCCKWIAQPTEFYWNAQGECCQVKHDYILKRIKRYNESREAPEPATVDTAAGRLRRAMEKAKQQRRNNAIHDTTGSAS